MKMSRLPMAAVILCSVSAICLPITTTQTLAQSAMKADKGQTEKVQTTALIKQAFDRSKGTPAFTKALESKDTKALTGILIKNGAPKDGTVTIGSGTTGGPPGLHFECCSKKSWGPVILDL
jgi:hypothetical protein